MLADSVRLVLFGTVAGAALAAEPAAVVASAEHRQPIPQHELAIQGQGTAVVFIGGFGDEISGIVPQLMEYLPSVAATECRAYYHWHAGYPQDCEKGAAALARRIQEYRAQNPGADVVLIGHSMGAGMALRVARKLSAQAGRLFLITLDPSDRSVVPQRPAAVTWWGNAYVVHSRSGHDYIAVLGGRWNNCRRANLNLAFDGREVDEAGYPYIHDNALSLMLSRGRGKHASLYDALVLQLKKAASNSPEGGKPRPQQPQGQTNTK